MNHYYIVLMKDGQKYDAAMPADSSWVVPIKGQLSENINAIAKFFSTVPEEEVLSAYDVQIVGIDTTRNLHESVGCLVVYRGQPFLASLTPGIFWFPLGMRSFEKMYEQMDKGEEMLRAYLVENMASSAPMSGIIDLAVDIGLVSSRLHAGLLLKDAFRNGLIVQQDGIVSFNEERLLSRYAAIVE